MFGLKSPLLIYADIGLVGTYVKQSEQGAENGFVYVYYKPLGKMQTIKLEKPINKNHIKFLNSTQTDIPGVESSIFFIYTNEEGSLMEFLHKSIMEENAKLRGIIKSLRLQNATQKQISEEASSGVESYSAKIQNINKSRRPSSSPFEEPGGFGRPGFEEFDY